MDNSFAKLNPSTLGNILSRCDIADIARMRCTDRALASLLKTRSVRNKICEWKQINNEYGYSLIIFQAQNSDEISELRAIRAREIHLIKAGNGVVMLEDDVPRRRLVVYEGRREAFKLGELWHRDSKFSANQSSVLSFAGAGGDLYNYIVMKTNELEWKWIEHEECRFTHPALSFTFMIEGDKFMKMTSLLPMLPLPLRIATSTRFRPQSMVGTELFDVNRQTNQPPLSWELPHVLPHLAFELKHVFEWGDGMIYMLFVGDRNNGQVDLGAWMIQDMPIERLDFAVFYLHKHRGSKGHDNTCRGISDWLKLFLLPYIYASPASSRFDKVELISSHNNDLFIIRKEKAGEGIVVELWLKRENSWGKLVRLIAGAAGYAQHVVSFCVWRLSAQYFGIDCILVLAKLREVEQGAWWVVKRQGLSAVVISHGMLQGINDGTRFCLVRHLHSKLSHKTS